MSEMSKIAEIQLSIDANKRRVNQIISERNHQLHLAQSNQAFDSVISSKSISSRSLRQSSLHTPSSLPTKQSHHDDFNPFKRENQNHSHKQDIQFHDSSEKQSRNPPNNTSHPQNASRKQFARMNSNGSPNKNIIPTTTTIISTNNSISLPRGYSGKENNFVQETSALRSQFSKQPEAVNSSSLLLHKEFFANQRNRSVLDDIENSHTFSNMDGASNYHSNSHFNHPPQTASFAEFNSRVQQQQPHVNPLSRSHFDNLLQTQFNQNNTSNNNNNNCCRGDQQQQQQKVDLSRNTTTNAFTHVNSSTNNIHRMNATACEDIHWNTFNTDGPLTSDRIGSSTARKHQDYQKIFIPVILESRMSNAEIKVGSSIVDLYKIDVLEATNELFSVFTGTSCIEESKGDKVTIKIYEASSFGFNLGLKEITNHLHLYEYNLHFHESGLVKMRDFFYFRNKLVIVTEFVGNQIQNINKRYLSLSSIKTIIQKAFKIVQNLNNLSLIHLNLNPSSVNYNFCRSNINICLSDFEHSKAVESEHPQNFEGLEIADVRYQAPEVLLNIEFSSKSDVWSLGCIMYELLTGEVLFKTNDKKEIIFIIRKVFQSDETGSDNESEHSNNNYLPFSSQYIESFQLQMQHQQQQLSVSSTSSVNSSQIISSGVAAENVAQRKINEINEKIVEIKQNFSLLKESAVLFDFLKSALASNPQNRLSIEECLSHPWLAQA